jgi:nucleoside-diphosphate-sugar epimerase
MTISSIAITGGAGFLGRHLIALLRSRYPDARLHVADLREAGPADLDPEVKYFGGVNVLDGESLRAPFEGVDAVVHLAGLVSFWRADRDKLYAVNRDGTRNVLLAGARAARPRPGGRMSRISRPPATTQRGFARRCRCELGN